MSYVKLVRKFTLACNSGVPDRPKRISEDHSAFIRKMVNDELDELEGAEDIVEQADALVDAIYYICDCAVKHGMNLDPLFEIVHSANMGKVVNGRVLKRDDGKVIKPEGWVDPKSALEREMKRQINHGSFSDQSLE